MWVNALGVLLGCVCMYIISSYELMWVISWINIQILVAVTPISPYRNITNEVDNIIQVLIRDERVIRIIRYPVRIFWIRLSS